MSRVDRQFYNSQVNAQWPQYVPPLTMQEAITAAKRLYRLIMGKKLLLPVKLTSGNRYSWSRRGVLYVNPGRGWKDMVHELSHWLMPKLHPGVSPHDSRHAYLERRMIQHVVAKEWLDGKLKTKPRAAKVRPGPKPAPVIRHERVLAAIKRWQSKAKRAKTALAKLERQRRYYEKRSEAAAAG